MRDKLEFSSSTTPTCAIVKVFKDIQITIPESDVLRHLGYGNSGASPPARIKRLVSEAIREADGLIQPRAVYGEMAAHLNEQGKVVLSSGVVLNNPHAARDWQNLEMVALVVCTIGSFLEERVTQLFAQGNSGAALILDNVGTVALRNVCREVDAIACRQAGERGMAAGPRFSPGSVGWDISDQRVLFELLPAGEAGVRLNDQFVMVPRKSVSFVVGMGSGVPVPRARRPCWYCDRLSCPSREQGC